MNLHRKYFSKQMMDNLYNVEVIGHNGEPTGRMYADFTLEVPSLFIQVSYSNNLIEIPILYDHLNITKRMARMDIIKYSEDSLMYGLVKFCTMTSVEFVHVITKDLMQRNDSYDREKQERFINSIAEECNEYQSTFTLFDLSNLIGEQKSVSKGDKNITGPNYSINNSELMDKIFSKFKNLACRNFVRRNWVLIKNDKTYLGELFKETCGWPLTSKEQEQKRRDEEDLRERQCTRCKKYFTNKENDSNSCSKHLTEILSQLNQNNEIMKNDITRITAEHSPINIKKNLYWNCCSNPLLGSVGCTPCKHTAI